MFTRRKLAFCGAAVVVDHTDLFVIACAYGGAFINDAGDPARSRNFLAFWAAASAAHGAVALGVAVAVCLVWLRPVVWPPALSW